jgi:pimeloyl-ACP methyl ester carboxylesterase
MNFNQPARWSGLQPDGGGDALNAKHALPIALVWCILVSGFQFAEAHPKTIVFAHVNVVPMDGNRILTDQDVTVIDDKIASIQPAANSVVSKDVQVIDATGKFLMPGLGEMHAHLPEPSDPPEYMQTTLALYLTNGVTTVRCMRGFPNHLTAKREVISGKLLGPSLFLAGPGLGGDSVTSPDDGVKQVLRQKSEGWDMIKIYPGLTRAEYDAIMATARRIGMRTGGHVPADVGVEHALETGQETIEHLDGYWEALHFEKLVPDETLRSMAIKTREAGVWNTPTMAIFRFDLGLETLQSVLVRPEMEYLPKFQADRWVKLFDDHVSKEHPALDVSRIVQRNRERFLKELNDVGAGILFGTDSPNLFEVPGFSVHAELAAMQQAGLSPYDVLLSATRRVGEYLRKNVGTVSVGAQADLILLEANPLDDVANVRRQAGVMLRGRWFAHSDVQRILQSIHDLHANYRVPSEERAAHTTGQNETTVADQTSELATDFDVLYGQVDVDRAKYQTIITKPKAAGRYPAVLLIGGLGCYSLDHLKPDDAYGKLLYGLTRKGYVTMRVEKNGEGASEGPPCDSAQSDLRLAVRRSLAGLNLLAESEYVDRRSIFILAHSIGPLEGVLVAEKFPIRGFIAAETIGKSWFEYQLENLRRQTLMVGGHYDEADRSVRTFERCLHRFLVEKQRPDQIVRDSPECADAVNTFGVSYTYLQQIADLDLAAEWKSVDVPVLVTWGTSDPTTTAEESHYLVEMINSFHPGRATYAEFPGMGHGIDLSPSPRAWLEAIHKHQHGEFDQDFLEKVESWLRTQVKRSE